MQLERLPTDEQRHDKIKIINASVFNKFIPQGLNVVDKTMTRAFTLVIRFG